MILFGVSSHQIFIEVLSILDSVLGLINNLAANTVCGLMLTNKQ